MPKVGLIMGSQSDWPKVQKAVDVLEEFGVPWEATVASAHRAPERVVQWVRTAPSRGVQVIIAAVGLAAHLPGVVAGTPPCPSSACPSVPGRCPVSMHYTVLCRCPRVFRWRRWELTPVGTRGCWRSKWRLWAIRSFKRRWRNIKSSWPPNQKPLTNGCSEH